MGKRRHRRPTWKKGWTHLDEALLEAEAQFRPTASIARPPMTPSQASLSAIIKRRNEQTPKPA